MKKYIFLALLFSGCANAGNTTGQINVLGVNTYDEVLISAGEMDDLVECASSFGRYVVDLKTDHGKAIYSLLLSAQAQNKSVKITGKNVCDVRTTAESIQYIEMMNP